MSKRFIATFVCSTLSLIGASGFALADTIARYECNVVGPATPEPLGDRNGHGVMVLQYSCFAVDGLMKGAVYTGSTITEWDGPKGTYLFGGGAHRVPGGYAVSQATEGTGAVIMKDGKPAGFETSGKGVFKFASGAIAALSGKAVNFVTKPTGPGRFSLEITD
jgi:hypothetical protein